MIKVRPFKDDLTNNLELMNEIYVLIFGSLMVLITDAILDPELRYAIGWAILCLILSASIINFYFVFKQIIPLIMR